MTLPNAPFPPSLLHAVARPLEADPDRTALIFGAARISYGEMARRALALAGALRQRGVAPGDRVAALVTPRPEGLISQLGVWLAGATWVGLNTRYTRTEQQGLLRDCGARVLVSVMGIGARDLTPDLAAHQAEGVEILRIGQDLWHGDLPAPDRIGDVAQHWRAALDAADLSAPAVVIYTSGSTGRPKGALITHAGLTFRAATMVQDRFGGAPIRMLLDLPINHIGALVSGIGLAFCSGGLLVLREGFDAGATLAAIAAHRLSLLIGVPAMLTRIADHAEFTKADLTSLQHICWGAGPLSEAVLDRYLTQTGAQLSQQYGMTETNGFIAYTPLTRDRDILLNTTGQPDPRLALRIAEADGTPVAPGIEGEVQAKLPHPFAGYLNAPDATAAALTPDGFFRTGDLARMRADGYLVFCGRAKEMFKSGGFNVYPREVEMTLESHPAIRAAAVLPRDDAAWGQVGIAFVEAGALPGAGPGAGPGAALDAGEIGTWCKTRLADFKVPKAIEILDALPRTALGKIDKQALLQRL